MNNLPIQTYESVVQQRDALAAENTAMKSIIQSVKEMAFSNRRNAHNCGPFKMTDLCGDLIAESSVVTPATDAFTRELMAKGVDALAVKYRNMIETMHPDTIAYGALKQEFESVIKEANKFAAQLRKGINDAQ
ncbi:hypothetical protein [Hafnia alvei]|uniref:hypothetical protein n=1 Tax=Hafnia alvei TaxID=569 RepID=UPI00345CDD66